jgi:PAS domain S-box-containing protein
MRDQHRPKQDLVSEVVALRKQVADLRDAMADRRRVEDALRHSEEQLRALVDRSPVGLCLLRLDGAVAAANRPFAKVLGYASVAELLDVGKVLGLFASLEERTQVIELVSRAGKYSSSVVLRCKSGAVRGYRIIGSLCEDIEAVALVVLEELSAASAGDTRSALARRDV